MAIFAIAYGAVALVAFCLFMSPAVADWGDYDAKELMKCAAFAAAAGLLWPLVAAFLVALAACGAYFSWKDRKDDGEDD